MSQKHTDAKDKTTNKGEATDRKLDQKDIDKLKQTNAPDFGMMDPEALAEAERVAAQKTAIKKAQKDLDDLDRADEDELALRAKAELDPESKKHVKMHKDGEHIKVHPDTVADHETVGWRVHK